MLVEGGGEALGSFFDADLVDKAMVFVAPRVVGGREAVTAVGGCGVEKMAESAAFVGTVTTPGAEGTICASPRTVVRTVGMDVLLEGWLHDPRQWVGEGDCDE